MSDYAPCAVPGHRAPHVAIRLGGSPCSTLDLFDRTFVLLAGPDAGAWQAGADGLGHPALVSYRIGTDLEADPAGSAAGADPVGELLDRFGISPSGALLVRPDGHVAWRSATGPTGDAAAVLGGVLSRLLARPV